MRELRVLAGFRLPVAKQPQKLKLRAGEGPFPFCHTQSPFSKTVVLCLLFVQHRNLRLLAKWTSTVYFCRDCGVGGDGAAEAVDVVTLTGFVRGIMYPIPACFAQLHMYVGKSPSSFKCAMGSSVRIGENIPLCLVLP